MIFKHTVRGFTINGILNQLGVTKIRAYTSSMYIQSYSEVASIMEEQVLVAASRLNQLLKEAYTRDMGMIPEYSNFPDYINVMNVALSHPRNVGVYWDADGSIQAKFVDFDGLGDLGDLQRIQKTVHPGGTLEGWIRIYNSWLSGTSNKYEEIVGARLSIMLGETKAPFWELIEDGNGGYAYPRNRPMRTLTTFTATYNNEMRLAYLRVLSIARSLKYV